MSPFKEEAGPEETVVAEVLRNSAGDRGLPGASLTAEPKNAFASLVGGPVGDLLE